MYAVLALVALLLAPAQGVTCTGNLAPPPSVITTDVTVSPGSTCSVSAVDITGSVTITNGASFSTSGVILISNSITATNAANINLAGNITVSGDVTINGAASVIIGPMATLTTLTVSNAATVTILGSVGTVSLQNVASLNFLGEASSLEIAGDGIIDVKGKILNGGFMRSSGEGATTFCGAMVFGGVSFGQVQGGVNIAASAGCPVSSIEGTISVNEGDGNVIISGAQLVASDVLIARQSGNVQLLQLSVSDVSLEQITGTVTITSMADSDLTAVDISGPIIIDKFITMGDFKLTNPGSTVSITNSDFGNEVLTIENPVGAVTFSNNKNVGLNVLNAPAVTASENMARTAEFKGNGPVVLNNNVFSMSLVCVENESVTGMNNDFIFADGQCNNPMLASV